MFKFILGKKIGMSQIFQDDGTVVPVTLIEAGPVTVTQIRSKGKDGYEAIQVGKDSRSQGDRGFSMKSGQGAKSRGQGSRSKRRMTKKEFRLDRKDAISGNLSFAIGQTIDVSVFKKGDIVKISGTSKGKGFQGVVKRHGFHGMPASHGHKHVTRTPGSIGQRFPQHTLKGTRMAGHMGAQRVSVKGLEIINVDKGNNCLLIKGAVPGHRGTLVEIRG